VKWADGIMAEIENSDNKWFRDSIVYHILIDRFAGYDAARNWKKPGFMGGNFAGIIEKLGYLHDLGINTIWLSPVFRNTAYHGYHITDFYTTDPRFGTQKELSDLVRKAHYLNIRVLLDFVPNHCSRKHPFFEEALLNRESPYRKWFYFNRRDNSYKCFLHFRDLPKINLDHKPAREHIMGAARHWLSMGIDGFRLDHVVGPSHAFWKYFRKEVNLIRPDAVLIGEAWLDGINFSMLKTIQIRRKYQRWMLNMKPWEIQLEYIDDFDGVLDFFFRYRITEYIAWKDDPEEYEQKLHSAMTDHYNHFPPDYYLPSFIENHDMNRFLFDAGQNRDKLKAALKVQFSLPQPPILYYGTETALSHDEPVSHKIRSSDVQARKPMPWDHLDYDMIEYCRELIAERKKRIQASLPVT
jgi:glycosidase